jgi:hypothetical protein
MLIEFLPVCLGLGKWFSKFLFPLVAHEVGLAISTVLDIINFKVKEVMPRAQVTQQEVIDG